jgi:hypothetical protein
MQKEVMRLIFWVKRHIFICYCLVFILLRLPMVSVPLERDEGSYAYVGWIWFFGKGLPYRDMYEMKPPLLYLI